MTATRLSPHLFRFDDTCQVYAVVSGAEAVLIDFGRGAILDALPALGVQRVTDVLVTHHHRDQVQGLARAVEAGARVWVPQAELDLVAHVDAHWQAREITNNYNSRQDRFSLLEPVPQAQPLRDYETCPFAGRAFTVVPTPGHTTGSVSLLAEIDGRRVAFTGDLIAGPGQVWSLAAMQWTYNGAEGAPATIASLLDLKDRAPDVLLPAHGRPIDPPAPAIDLLVERLWQLLRARGQNPRLFELRDRPYEALSPHLLRHRASLANTYVLVSDTGGALFFDFGYDFCTGIPAGFDRAARRPWLYTLPALKRGFGVGRVEVALPTHYHDDHVAGFNLLRAVEGTAVWAPESFADILELPARFDLPCLWPDPIAVDRRLPLGEPIRWHEYTFTLHPLPGHTRYAVAVALEVDGRRVLVAGDQYQGDAGQEWNYVYPNRFDAQDYARSAELYAQLAPDLILSGHWAPLWVADHPGYFDQLRQRGELLARLHAELIAPELAGLGAEGVAARLEPYQAEVRAGEPVDFTVEVRNPFDQPAAAALAVVAPAGWQAPSIPLTLNLAARAGGAAAFQVTPPAGQHVRRARVAVDVTIAGRPFGQQAEALVTVREEQP